MPMTGRDGDDRRNVSDDRYPALLCRDNIKGQSTAQHSTVQQSKLNEVRCWNSKYIIHNLQDQRGRKSLERYLYFY
jgi:hypothetical protein